MSGISFTAPRPTSPAPSSASTFGTPTPGPASLGNIASRSYDGFEASPSQMPSAIAPLAHALPPAETTGGRVLSLISRARTQALRSGVSELPFVAAVIADCALARGLGTDFTFDNILASLAGSHGELADHFLMQADFYANWPQPWSNQSAPTDAASWWSVHVQGLVDAQFNAHRDDAEEAAMQAASVLRVFIHAYMPQAANTDSFWLSQMRLRSLMTPCSLTPQFYAAQTRPAFADVAWTSRPSAPPLVAMRPIPSLDQATARMQSSAGRWVREVHTKMNQGYEASLTSGQDWRRGVTATLYNFFAMSAPADRLPSQAAIYTAVSNLAGDQGSCELLSPVFYNFWTELGHAAPRPSRAAQDWCDAVKRLVDKALESGPANRDVASTVRMLHGKLKRFVDHHLPYLTETFSSGFVEDQYFLKTTQPTAALLMLSPRLYSEAPACRLLRPLAGMEITGNQISDVFPRVEKAVFHSHFYWDQLRHRNLPTPRPGSNEWDHAAGFGFSHDVMPGPAFDPAFYRRQANAPASMPSLIAFHTWVAGNANGPASSAWDPDWYISQNADVAAIVDTVPDSDRGVVALEHWTNTGMPQGRAGSYAFNPTYYRYHFPDLHAFYIDRPLDLLQHWFKHGQREGRDGSACGRGIDEAIPLWSHTMPLGGNPGETVTVPWGGGSARPNLTFMYYTGGRRSGYVDFIQDNMEARGLLADSPRRGPMVSTDWPQQTHARVGETLQVATGYCGHDRTLAAPHWFHPFSRNELFVFTSSQRNPSKTHVRVFGHGSHGSQTSLTCEVATSFTNKDFGIAYLNNTDHGDLVAVDKARAPRYELAVYSGVSGFRDRILARSFRVEGLGPNVKFTVWGHKPHGLNRLYALDPTFRRTGRDPEVVCMPVANPNLQTRRTLRSFPWDAVPANMADIDVTTLHDRPTLFITNRLSGHGQARTLVYDVG